jgi:hypothetical protein
MSCTERCEIKHSKFKIKSQGCISKWNEHDKLFNKAQVSEFWSVICWKQTKQTRNPEATYNNRSIHHVQYMCIIGVQRYASLTIWYVSRYLKNLRRKNRWTIPPIVMSFNNLYRSEGMFPFKIIKTKTLICHFSSLYRIQNSSFWRFVGCWSQLHSQHYV